MLSALDQTQGLWWSFWALTSTNPWNKCAFPCTALCSPLCIQQLLRGAAMEWPFHALKMFQIIKLNIMHCPATFCFSLQSLCFSSDHNSSVILGWKNLLLSHLGSWTILNESWSSIKSPGEGKSREAELGLGRKGGIHLTQPLHI